MPMDPYPTSLLQGFGILVALFFLFLFCVGLWVALGTAGPHLFLFFLTEKRDVANGAASVPHLCRQNAKGTNPSGRPHWTRIA